MAEDEKTKLESEEPEGDESQEESETKGGGLKKIIIFAGGGLLVIGLSVAGALFFMGSGDDEAVKGDHTEQSGEVDSASEVGSHDKQAAADAGIAGDAEYHESVDEMPEFSIEDDPTVLENIVSNLEFLDYEPDAIDLPEDPDQKAVEDSTEQANWLDEEKAALKEREQALSKRESELQKLDREVSRKVLRLEQAESTRIAKLAKLYDGMDARSVTKLMANLDNNTIVMILPRMNIKNASAVLSLLPALRAAKLSKQMITIAEK